MLLQAPDEANRRVFDRWWTLEVYPDAFNRDDVHYDHVSNEEVVCINYTSGTTGFSKGVMITANNFAGNVTYAHDLNLLFRGERILAFLPMAHVYGCAFDFLYSLSAGVHVTLLGITLPRTTSSLQCRWNHLIITVRWSLKRFTRKNIAYYQQAHREGALRIRHQ